MQEKWRAAGLSRFLLPGACAAVIWRCRRQGLPSCTFLRFPSAKTKQREDELRVLVDLPYALSSTRRRTGILRPSSRSPGHLATTERSCLRELTKLFETIHSCPSGRSARLVAADANRQRGESVLFRIRCHDAGGSGEGERVKLPRRRHFGQAGQPDWRTPSSLARRRM